MLPRRLKTLEANLKLGSTEDRVALLAELGRGWHPYALDLLYPMANHENPALAAAAQQAFEKFCIANPQVAMRHSSTLVRHEAAFVLGERRVEAAISELSRVARSDADDALRLACVQALGAIGTKNTIPGLRTALKDPSLKVKQASFAALHQIGGSAVSEAVADLLGDHDWELRQRAHSLLLGTGWMPQTREQKALWGIINGRFDDVVSQVPEAIEPLIVATLRVNDPGVRHWSATALARIGSNEIRRRIRGALASPNPAVRSAASDALRVFGDDLVNSPIDPTPQPQVSTDRRQQVLESTFPTATLLFALMGHP